MKKPIASAKLFYLTLVDSDHPETGFAYFVREPEDLYEVVEDLEKPWRQIKFRTDLDTPSVFKIAFDVKAIALRDWGCAMVDLFFDGVEMADVIDVGGKTQTIVGGMAFNDFLNAISSSAYMRINVWMQHLLEDTNQTDMELI